MRPQQPSGFGRLDGGLKQIAPIQSAEFFVSLAEEVKNGRWRNRCRAAFVHEIAENEAKSVGRFTEKSIRPHCIGRSLGAAAQTAPDDLLFRRGIIDIHDAEAGNAAHQWVDDPLNEGAGQGGIHSVAAVHKDFSADVDGLRLRSNNHRLRLG
jgi:hypothetical protein